VNLAAVYAERGMMLPDRLLVRRIEKAVNPTGSVIEELHLSHAEPIAAFGSLRSGWKSMKRGIGAPPS
jgi:hypothetical protein